MHGDKQRYNIALASIEANQCQDLLSQAQYHVSRARRIDEEERNLRTKQEQERMAFKQRQEEERRLEAEKRRKAGEEMLAKREEFKEKTKNALLFSEPPPDMKKGRGRGRRDEYVSDSGSGAERNPEGGEGGEKPRKKATKGRKKREGKSDKRRRRRSGSESDGPREKRGRKKASKGTKTAAKEKDDGLSGKQKLRIVSKATISTSESESDKEGGRKSRSRSRSSGEYFLPILFLTFHKWIRALITRIIRIYRLKIEIWVGKWKCTLQKQKRIRFVHKFNSFESNSNLNEINFRFKITEPITQWISK